MWSMNLIKISHYIAKGHSSSPVQYSSPLISDSQTKVWNHKTQNFCGYLLVTHNYSISLKSMDDWTTGMTFVRVVVGNFIEIHRPQSLS